MNITITYDCNVMIGLKNVFGQPIKNDMKAYHNIQKITTGQ